MPSAGGSDFFRGGGDGPHGSIRDCLRSPDPAVQMAAVKQVIAQMTVGKDTSSHFQDIAQLVTSPHVQVKKLVYLYLIQNAKSQPDKAVMHAGSFVKDSMHENPLVRGIALRTMTALQVPTMSSYGNEVVMRGLRDSDPYVRRTAAYGVLKLYHTAPDVLQETGRIQDLLDLLGDPIAAVVAAAVAAVCELVPASPQGAVLVQAVMAQSATLLNALSECSEWGQISLLEGIALVFKDRQASANMALPDAEAIVDRISPFLQSNNPAVVLSSVNIVVNFLQAFCNTRTSKLAPLQQAELEKRYSARIAGPLVSLTSSVRFEMRYVALRTIRVITQRYKDHLVPHVKAFLVKYDDPIYIKLEKVDVMVSLCNRTNAELVVAELAEYANEVDVELARKAVRSLGVVAVKNSSIAAQCVERLVALIETRVSYIVQEAAVVVQQILRQYPATYESIIVKLCKALDVLDDPESKSAVVWVVGEYADRIENVVVLMQIFFDAFNEESLTVQLATLTAAVKTFLTPSIPQAERQGVLEQALALATASRVPDLRDRACFYWRLVLADPEAAVRVVKCEKERIVDSGSFDRGLLTELLGDLGRLSAVLHRPIASAVGDGKRRALNQDDDDVDDDDESGAAAAARERAARALEEGGVTASAAAASPSGGVVDFSAGAVPATTNFLSGGGGTGAASAASAASQLDFMMVLDGASSGGGGLSVAMAWEPATPMPRLHTRFSLTSGGAGTSARPSAKVSKMQLNTNCWGLGFAQELAPFEIVAGKSVDCALSVNCANPQRATSEVQVALQAEPMGVLFFVAPPVPPSMMLAPAPSIDPHEYASAFQALPVAWSMPTYTSGAGPRTAPQRLAPAALKVRGITLVHRQDDGQLAGLHLHAKCLNGAKLYAEVTVDDGVVVLAHVKCPDAMLGDFFGSYVLDALHA